MLAPCCFFHRSIFVSRRLPCLRLPLSEKRQKCDWRWSSFSSSLQRRLPGERLQQRLIRWSGATSSGSYSDKKQYHDPTRSNRRIITYLTDIEGDGAYLDRFVKQSRVLMFRTTDPRLQNTNQDGDASYFPYSHCIDFTTDDAVLVFGGDVWDKGGSDLYVIRQLLDLHRRYGPDRVYWTFGNRDTNKMRILQELGIYPRNGATSSSSSSSSRTQLPRHEGVYWRRPSPLSSDVVANVSDYLVPDDAAKRLQWILASTMGSPNAFELRRQELQRERTSTYSNSNNDSRCGGFLSQTEQVPPVTATEVTDHDVVESYRQSCHPQGELGQYLSKGHLVIRMGQVLFLHGALPITLELLKDMAASDKTPTNKMGSSSVWQDLRFAMPWLHNDENNIKPHHDDEHIIPQHIDEWFLQLNFFARSCVTNWKEYVKVREKSTTTSEQREQAAFGEEGKEEGEPIWSTHGGYNTSNPNAFTNLIQYAQAWLPGGISNPTVVYSSFCQQGSVPLRFYADASDPLDRAYHRLVQDFFMISGVKLIACGHQPQGDTLLPIRIESMDRNDGHDDVDDFDSSDGSGASRSNWILCCDTSYSGDTLWRDSTTDAGRNNLGRGRGSSFRGDHTVCEVLIELCVSTGVIENVQYHGVLSDGSKYEARLPLDGTNETDWTGTSAPANGVSSVLDSALEGESGPSLWWVKAKLEGNNYLVTTGQGYDVWNSIVALLPNSK